MTNNKKLKSQVTEAVVTQDPKLNYNLRKTIFKLQDEDFVYDKPTNLKI